MWSMTRELLEELIALHDEKSHKNTCSDDDFIIMRIDKFQLRVLEKNAHNRAFWEAFNKSRKLS